MYIFKPFEFVTEKYIYVSGVHSEHITQKTIMHQITKTDEFELINPDHIMITEKDRNRYYVKDNTFVTTQDLSVWVIKGKAKDMDGVAIPNTYLLNLVGKLENIEIDADILTELENANKSIEKYQVDRCNLTSTIHEYEQTMNLIIDNIPDYEEIFDCIDRDNFSLFRNILTEYFKDVKNLVKLVTGLSIYSVTITMLGIIYLLFF